MAFSDDCVVRTVYYKYLHPKEVHIANGVVNKEINVAAGKRPRGPQPGGQMQGVPPAISESSPNAPLAFAYPYGCSLLVQKPAFPVLTSGPLSFPLNRPVCALCVGPAHQSRPHRGQPRPFMPPRLVVCRPGRVDRQGGELEARECPREMADRWGRADGRE